jgi:translation initiation factor 2 beta subunit (eIF-2beta)/eIF-5
MSYTLDQLLNFAYNDIKGIKRTDVFVAMPKIINNNRKTYIENFSSICSSIKRSDEEVIKFINKGLSAKSSISDGVVKFDKIYPMLRVKETISDYIKQFVMCQGCKSKDTQVKSFNRENVLLCNSCKCQKTIILL